MGKEGYRDGVAGKELKEGDSRPKRRFMNTAKGNIKDLGQWVEDLKLKENHLLWLTHPQRNKLKENEF